MLIDVGPVELWATRQRRPSAAANPQGLAARVPLAQSDPWLEPIVDCSFDPCRTSHSVAASERLHHNPSFLRSSGSGERVHTVWRHITATVCDGPPARIQRADQASWNSR